MLAGMEGAIAGKLRDPVFWHGVTQLVKTVVAAVVAWVIAATTLELPQPFLAPWAALLVVHATVYRTFSRGLQQVVATVRGGAAGGRRGARARARTPSPSRCCSCSGCCSGRCRGSAPRRPRSPPPRWWCSRPASPTTCGCCSRLLDTGIGVAVGLLVNVAVWPPLLRRTAIVAMNRIDDAIGELLEDIGPPLESRPRGRRRRGVGRADARPRRRARPGLGPGPAGPRERPDEPRGARPASSATRSSGTRLLHRMEQAVAETRSMARTLGGPATPRQVWEPAVRRRLDRAAHGRRAGHRRRRRRGDPRRAAAAGALVDELDSGGRLPTQWPVHGALVINLRNIVDAMDEVAAANPLDDPPRPLDRMRWRTAAGRADRAIRRGS